jgi:hypothetical protein
MPEPWKPSGMQKISTKKRFYKVHILAKKDEKQPENISAFQSFKIHV